MDADPRSTTMPFGEFNGRPVSELPDWYLYRLLDKRLWPNLAEARDEELRRRSAERRERRAA